jgi:hypothetical protein
LRVRGSLVLRALVMRKIPFECLRCDRPNITMSDE